MTTSAFRPVLLAEPVDEKRWRAWCPFCVTYHTHSSEAGERAAHCHDPNSPFDGSGYLLIRFDDKVRLGRERAKRTRRLRSE